MVLEIFVLALASLLPTVQTFAYPDNKAFVITVTSLNHSGHSLVDNPLSIPTHLRNLDEYQAVISTVRKHRQAVIPYSESRRVL
jgi:hypothetical protein